MERKFVIDVNVGRLAKWLRVMGYDALFDRDADDDLLLRIASEEDRILLTRDTYIMEHRVVASGEVKAFLLTSDSVWEQLKCIVQSLELNDDNRFSRCIECNVPLHDVRKEDVKDMVPPFVYATQEEFMRCHRCSKIYWKGTHWQNMRYELSKVNGEEA